MQRSVLSVFALFILSTLVAAAGIGCGETVIENDPRPASERNAEPQPLNSEVVVDAQRFSELRAEGATIIDTRAEEDYLAGHVPGAVHAPGGRAYKDDNGILLNDVVELQSITRRLGIDRDRPVVIYGNPVDKGAGRLFWTLEYLGHGGVRLYGEGYTELKAQLDFEPSTEDLQPEKGDFVVARRESVRATADEVLDIVNGERDGIIIDTRRRAEFEGTEDRGDPRQGHIPQAIYYYWKDLFADEDGGLQSKDALRQEFNSLGLTAEGTLVVPYCQTGTRSSYVYAILRWLGDDEATNYDGSWVEWSRLEDAPVADGEDG
jgi:thiosulfate/3-mercaptopyruvate sulfurtransferase